MINFQFFKDCGLILLNEDNARWGIDEGYMWTFPGLVNDWVVQSSTTQNAGMIISEFVIHDNTIYTSSSHPFFIEQPTDLNDLKDLINKLNIKYKNAKEKLLLESIRDDFG